MVAIRSIRVPSAKNVLRTGKRTRERWIGNVNERAGFHVEWVCDADVVAAMWRVIGHSELAQDSDFDPSPPQVWKSAIHVMGSC